MGCGGLAAVALFWSHGDGGCSDDVGPGAPGLPDRT